MQVLYHLGAHCTDGGALLRVLLNNRQNLRDLGTIIPEAEQYAPLLRAAAAAFAGRPLPAGNDTQLLAALLPDPIPAETRRLVLSFDGFLAFPRDAVNEAAILPLAAPRAQALRNLFPQEEVQFALALRNPASWLPALSDRRQAKGEPPLAEDFPPEGLSWLELVQRLQKACPDVPLLIWCDEDAPVLWPTILRNLTQHPEELELDGALDFPASLLNETGAKRLAAWMARSQPKTDSHRRRGLATTLRRFGLPEAMEQEILHPQWDQATVDRVSARYEADCEAIAHLQGVTFLTPYDL